MSTLEARRAGRGQHQAFALPPSPAWMAEAACASVGGDGWYPEQGESPFDAKRVCVRCDIAEQCLAFAVTRDERYGVWGGLTEYERRAVRRGLVSVRDAVQRVRDSVFRSEQRARELDKTRMCRV